MTSRSDRARWAGHDWGVERAIVAGVVVALAAVVSVVLERARRRQPPTQGRAGGEWAAPTQVDRDDFSDPGAPWLVAVFTSATCDSCRQTMVKVTALASADVAVQEVEVSTRKDLHDRYGIEAVPTLVVVDADGVVRASVVGPPSTSELWSTVAEIRESAGRAASDAGRTVDPDASPEA